MWTLENPNVDLELLEEKERNKHVDLVSEFYQNIQRKYAGYVQVYTDGSKDSAINTTGSAILQYYHTSKLKWLRVRQTS